MSGPVPWIIDVVEDKIQTALGMEDITSLEASSLNSKPWVANEFLDVLTCYVKPEVGLDKLVLTDWYQKVSLIEEEVVGRLANMCPRVTILVLRDMHRLTEAGRMSIISLLR